MPKKKNKDTEDIVVSDLVESKEEAQVTVPSSRPKKVKPAKRFTFDQYARKKGFREQHVPGLRAFVKNPRMRKTVEEWDDLLKDY